MNSIYKKLISGLDLDTLKEIKGYSKYLADLRNGRIWDKEKQDWKVANPNKFGYVHVTVKNDDGEFKSESVHHLIMLAALEGFDYKGKLGLEIDHLNNDQSDNRFTNLELVSRAENLRRRKMGKDRNYLSKEEIEQLLTEYVQADLKFGEVCDWYLEMSKKFNAHFSTIQKIILKYRDAN
ncbi:HNH endonuclease [Ureibacillus xyleni]|uniref:HNH endonuclease n=1 Tax=Ureibacillus xyleni TaxID=614648 RepID=A0A285SX16_9BACL|nr:HNH endonuclease [Ureibacillus xyleni]SOC12889.1 HNH endonuclease [Ureibacillus xyleni]